jgi:Tfp pilus assembly protein PilF
MCFNKVINYGEALKQINKSLEIDPNYINALLIKG